MVCADLGADDGAEAAVEVLGCFDAHVEDGMALGCATRFGRFSIGRLLLVEMSMLS